MIKSLRLRESQAAGNKLAILSRKGCSHRELIRVIVERFEGAGSRLGLQDGLPNNRELAPKGAGASVMGKVRHLGKLPWGY